jgi:hypothetical protein
VSVSHPATDEDWRDTAECAGTDYADLWYATNPSHTYRAQIVCAGCPVRHPCLIDGLHDEHGVWGGYTATERARLIEQLPRDLSAIRLTLARAAYIGPAAFGVADTTNPTKE